MNREYEPGYDVRVAELARAYRTACERARDAWLVLVDTPPHVHESDPRVQRYLQARRHTIEAHDALIHYAADGVLGADGVCA